MSLLALPSDSVFDDSPPNIPDSEPGADGTPKPKRGRPPKDPNAAPTVRKPRNPWPGAEETERQLTTLVEGAAFLVGMANAFDGETLAKGGPAIVHELVELAKTDKTLRKYLEISATPGKYGPLTIACISVALPIVINHNLIPLPKSARSTQEG
jgi:hypothetical protein